MIFTREQIRRAINDPGYRGAPGEPVSFPVGGGLVVSVGANNPFVVARPSVRMALEINQVGWFGDNVAGAADEWLRILTGVDYEKFAGLGAPATSSLIYLQGSQSSSAGVARTSLIGNSTTTATNSLSGLIIRTFAPLATHLWDQHIVPLRWPIVLWGDDPGKPPVLGCFPSPGHLSAGLMLIGREWPYDTENY